MFRHLQIGFCGLAGCICIEVAVAAPVDFNTFTDETYPATDGFSEPNWNVIDSSTVEETTNSWISIFHGTESITNKIITGTLIPGSDDDMPGLVLGFNAGDTTNPNADFILIDWKGATQNFNFNDPSGNPDFHNLTPATDAFVGVAFSRVTGIPTADEFWGHESLPENPDGGVEELARGATLGNQPYNRSGGGHDFAIIYEPDRIQVRIDGSTEFDLSGSFPDGVLGMFESHQAPGATYTNFSISDVGVPGDFNADGSVNLDDFNILADNFLEGTTFAQGDNNLDGDVNHLDFIEFVDLFNAANPGSASVPEPSTLLLAVMGLVAFGSVKWFRTVSVWKSA